VSEPFGAALPNGIFEPLWNRNYDHVQITAAETLGVERRGGFTRQPGRCATDPEPRFAAYVAGGSGTSARFDATRVRNEKLKVLQSVRPYDFGMVATSVVRGNMGLGWSTGNLFPDTAGTGSEFAFAHGDILSRWNC